MKNTFILSFILIVSFSCRDEELFPIPDIQPGVFIIAEENTSSNSFNIADIENTSYISRIGYQSYGFLTATGIDLFIDYSGDEAGAVALKSISAVEADGENLSGIPETTITSAEAASAFGLQPSDLNEGDSFTITFAINLEDGRTINQWNNGFGSVCDSRTPGICNITINVSN